MSEAPVVPAPPPRPGTTTRWDVDPGQASPKPLQRKAPEGMRTFTLHRKADRGPEGVVLEGVIFSTGWTIIHWLTPAPRGSLNFFENFQQFRNIHIRGHEGTQAVVTFGDGEQLKF